MTAAPCLAPASGCRRRSLLLIGAALFVPAARGQTLVAPNVVRISEKLVTAGQPRAEALAHLGALGFQAVVYLAPNTVSDAVEEEPALLAAQGIGFIHIPIPFDAPQPSHLTALSDALDRLRDRKVLVHCQTNLRASSLVFLHRVIHERENPADAYAAVAAVWSPRGVWRRLLVEQLRHRGIDFEPY